MPALHDVILAGSPVPAHRPWPRGLLAPEVWDVVAGRIVQGHWTLLGLWGEPEAAHMAILDESRAEIGVVSVACPNRHFSSVARRHPPAIRLERAVRDLTGLEPVGCPDPRPWLDHGRWDVSHPLGDARPRSSAPSPYEFLAAEGEGLHQIPVGPVHAGIIEPGHFRFTASGETVVRLEPRLGYAHKGIVGLMQGAPLARAAELAGRASGDSTVANAIGFARAAEAALEVEAPQRALWLRALMAELERLANHFGDIGAICNDASFALMHAHCAVLRERVLRAADSCFGHRLMRDRVAPGGVAVDLDGAGVTVLRELVGASRRKFPALVELYDNTASLQDRTVGAGHLKPELARQYGAGGYVGRASGRDFDARRLPGNAPYDLLDFQVPVRQDGDVDARVWIRILEVEQSLSLVEQILDRLPGGPVRAELPPPAGPCEGMALVEGFRGDILVWLRLAPNEQGNDGVVASCCLRDPSWFQWPLLEAAIEGNIVADFPLCNKSFNCSYSGHDL